MLVDPTFLSPERQREVHDSDIAGQHRRVLGPSKQQLVEQARTRNPHRSLELVELQAEASSKTSMAAFEVLTPPNPAYRELVRGIDVPSLLVIGDDPVVTLDMATELQSLHAGLRIEQVANAGHGLPFEQPERLAEVVLSFLRALA